MSVTFGCVGAGLNERHIRGVPGILFRPPIIDFSIPSFVCCVYARRLICREHNANVLSDPDRFCLTHRAPTSGRIGRFSRAEKEGKTRIHSCVYFELDGDSPSTVTLPLRIPFVNERRNTGRNCPAGHARFYFIPRQ